MKVWNSPPPISSLCKRITRTQFGSRVAMHLSAMIVATNNSIDRQKHFLVVIVTTSRPIVTFPYGAKEENEGSVQIQEEERDPLPSQLKICNLFFFIFLKFCSVDFHVFFLSLRFMYGL